MKFDLRTCDLAYEFVLNFTGMDGKHFSNEWHIICRKDFEAFWNQNIEKFKSVDISNLKIMAFHITSSLDECRDIKSNGLMDLQKVLSSGTLLRRLLTKNGIIFDLSNKTLSYQNELYDIRYDRNKNVDLLSEKENAIDNIAYKIFCDYCINGFLCNDNIYDYLANVHQRPEFLMTLGNFLPIVKNIENEWIENSKSYRVDFYATIDQVHMPIFGDTNIMCKNGESDYYLEIKKNLLSIAIDRAYNELGSQAIRIIEGLVIPPEQIISITEIPKEKE